MTWKGQIPDIIAHSHAKVCILLYHLLIKLSILLENPVK